tara:strand:- start:1018 stop:1290 length:273 start_codon:yes stop_codon:yes gene_type:complete
MIENEDYSLLASNTDEDHWDIRLMTGEFAETVISFGKIVAGVDCLNFDYEIVSTPDPELKVNDTRLQTVAGSVLYSIVESAAEKEINEQP